MCMGTDFLINRIPQKSKTNQAPPPKPKPKPSHSHESRRL